MTSCCTDLVVNMAKTNICPWYTNQKFSSKRTNNRCFSGVSLVSRMFWRYLVKFDMFSPFLVQVWSLCIKKMNRKCIEIAIWPGTIFKSQEMPFIERAKLCDKQHYDELFSRRKTHMLGYRQQQMSPHDDFNSFLFQRNWNCYAKMISPRNRGSHRNVCQENLNMINISHVEPLTWSSLPNLNSPVAKVTISCSPGEMQSL